MKHLIKAGIVSLLILLMLTACGKKEKETVAEETTVNIDEEYPGTIAVKDAEKNTELFGVMHACVLDVQKGDGANTVYTVRDNRDPDNAWSVDTLKIKYVVPDVKKGDNIVLLFEGNMTDDPDSVEFIVLLPDKNYEIKTVEGKTTSNMMGSFSVEVEKSKSNGTRTYVFVKDNCDMDREALNGDSDDHVLVVYADCGEKELYPLKVYKVKK
ncbi:MAG: hypothetical protein Q4B67_00500 [Eubacteriales bacterium]|nr:hypothetical protein [Eubacteriales bacterium]